MNNYPLGNSHEQRFALVSTQAAKEAGKTFHGSEEAMQAYEAELQVLPDSMDTHRQAGNASANLLHYWRHLSDSWLPFGFRRWTHRKGLVSGELAAKDAVMGP